MHTGQDTAGGHIEPKPTTNEQDAVVASAAVSVLKGVGFEAKQESLPGGATRMIVDNLSKQKAGEIQQQQNELDNNTTPIQTVADDLPGTIDRLKETQGREFLGLSSPGLKQVNDALWGWRGLTFFAAEPGIGKTTYLLQVLGDIVDNNTDACVVFFSFEMSRVEIVTRMICGYSNHAAAEDKTERRHNKIVYRHLVCGAENEEENERGLKLGDPFSDMVDGGIAKLTRQGDRIVIVESKDINNDTSTTGDRVGAMAAKIQQAKQRTGCDRVFVVVDNMQAMPVPVGEYQNDLDRDRETIAALGNLQHNIDDPIVVISEQAKGRQGDTRGVTSMLGTGRSGYSADNVLLLHRPAGLDQESANIDDESVCLQLTIAKGRDGVLRKVIPMEFNHKTTIFEETDGELIKEKQEQVIKQAAKKSKQKGDKNNWNGEGGKR